MPFITLTVLVTAIVMAHSPIHVDSMQPPRDRPDPTPTTQSSHPPPPPHPSAPSKHHEETNGQDFNFPPPPPSPRTRLSKGAGSDGHRRNKRAPRHMVNLGKKIGLLFVGMAAVLQVAVVGFLGFKRWQFSNMKESVADSPA